MPEICFYFQVHQPYRLRRYSVFDIGRRLLRRRARTREIAPASVAEKCYLPTNRLLLDAIDGHEGRFRDRVLESRGMALEQIEADAPEVIESFQKLAATGCVEFLGETSHHSLALLLTARSSARRSNAPRAIEQLFGRSPTRFRNTELIYDDDHRATWSRDIGFPAMLAEGADHLLGWRSAQLRLPRRDGTRASRCCCGTTGCPTTSRSASRNRGWEQWPLDRREVRRAGSARCSGSGDLRHLFMDYETFGEHQWAETGIFDFLGTCRRRSCSDADISFQHARRGRRRAEPVGDARRFPHRSRGPTPSATSPPGSATRCSEPPTTRSTRSAGASSARRPPPRSHDDWRRLTTRDHFYYMCTKWFSDGDVHKYFSPLRDPARRVHRVHERADRSGAELRG